MDPYIPTIPSLGFNVPTKQAACSDPVMIEGKKKHRMEKKIIADYPLFKVPSLHYRHLIVRFWATKYHPSVPYGFLKDIIHDVPISFDFDIKIPSTLTF